MKFLFAIIAALFFICASGVQAQNCPVACPALFKPTCGFNGSCHKQFANDCLLNFENCGKNGDFKIVDLAKCSEKDAVQC